MTLSLSRRLFEWFGVLIPPHNCELCGGRHWTWSAAVRCWWNSHGWLDDFDIEVHIEHVSHKP